MTAHELSPVEARRTPSPGPRLRFDQLIVAWKVAGAGSRMLMPPGPISNPGRASLVATMDPDGSDYLYFVAKSPREHVFSRTLGEHRRAVDQYQR